MNNVENWPSVTQVLSPWTAQGFANIPPALLERASDRGTAVHDICGRIALGEFVVGIPTELQGYVTSFEKWLTTQVENVILAETRLYDNGLMFHGKEDLIVTLVDGRIALVDLKTPLALQKSWAVQLAAYNRLAHINGYDVGPYGSLRLDPAGGTPKMKWYEEGPAPFNAFLSALNVWRYMN
jgi:hypothetical protein